MAEIKEESALGIEHFKTELRAMDDASLLAQDLVQQGGVHALSSLLKLGCTENIALKMIASMRQCAMLIRIEAERRGKPSLFASDQTEFH